LVLVKWWLLALPQYLIVAVLSSLLSLLVLIGGLALLFTGRYPAAMFDLVLGIDRWVHRVAAYAALMTDAYPPFRLDVGGQEPTAGGAPPEVIAPEPTLGLP
jgi:hypothetical protein